MSSPFQIRIDSILVVASLFLSPSIVRADANNDSISQMISLLGHPDREFRAAALEQVRGSAKGTDKTKLFADQLPKLDAFSQAALIAALADRGDATARPAIIATFNSSTHESVRSAALAALGEIGLQEDIPVLIKALTSASSSESQSAQTALVRLRGDTVVKSLAAETNSAKAGLKASLIEVLAARRALSEIPAFISASVDDDAKVRGAAMAALGLLANESHLPAMLPAVLKASKGGERDTAEKNVALVCAKIENEQKRGDALIAAMETIEPAKRDELMSLIGRVGGKRLISFVADIATGADVARRTIGIDALSKWPDSSTADKLLEIAGKATDATERRQAFQGYVKVAAVRDRRNDKQRLDGMKKAFNAAKTSEEKTLVINRTRTSYDIDAVRFVLPFVDEAEFAAVASETIVEIAHHREVRDAHKEEFDKILDKVIAVSKNAEIIERAQRYKKGETWERAKK